MIFISIKMIISHFGIFGNGIYHSFMTSIHSKEYQDLIDRLVKARKDANLTQKEVAVLLNKPQSYISKIETYQRRVDVLELKEFARLYKIRIETFI